MSNNLSLPKGYRLNEYIIAKKLSSGGFSVVYLAYDKNNNPVAIKEFLPSSLNLRLRGDKISFLNSREKERFQLGLKLFKDEAEIVMNLKHNNIIEIINFFESNGTAYLVMPYEYGMTLSKYITLEKLVNEKEVISIAEGIFNAVHLFHENNVIHLDLKPGNIWLRPNKEALILDFGTARNLNDKEKSLKPPLHTPGYAAPEQHREFFQPTRVGKWTDYYGLGTTLYTLLVRRSPAPSPKLIEDRVKINIVNDRQGQYNQRLLEIVQELMQLNWDDRKNIDLPEIIRDLGRLKPIEPIELLANTLNKVINY